MWVFFLILVLLNVLELSVASILLNKYIYMGGLGLFSTHELPLCCDHDYYCFCPSHSKFPIGCGFHMLKVSWGHLNVLYFNSYSLLIVICWCICDISHIHSLSNKYNLRTSSLMLLPLISSSISIPMLSCFLCLSVHILQTAENKNGKKNIILLNTCNKLHYYTSCQKLL